VESFGLSELTIGMIISRNVPGYEVDSLTTRVSFETNGAIALVAVCNSERSGCRFPSSGVGTHIVMTLALDTKEKSVLALYAPLVSAAANWVFEMSSTGLIPELICVTLASKLSMPITVHPASTAAIAKGRPT
jgi:hypothetical protein